MTQIRVSPRSLSDAARSVARAAEEFGTGVTSLQSTVTSESPWGADEQGTLFGAAYLAVLNHAIEVYGSHVDLLREAADGLATWSDRSAATEHDLHARIAAVGAGS